MSNNVDIAENAKKHLATARNIIFQFLLAGILVTEVNAERMLGDALSLSEVPEAEMRSVVSHSHDSQALFRRRSE
ncbi:hypothetical protein PG995_008730 [Apiospora arundinis]